MTVTVTVSQDPFIVHQYANESYKWTAVDSKSHVMGNITYTDIYNNSCLNGWVCGNIAATPVDIARFHWYLHNTEKIVSNHSLAQMMNFYGFGSYIYGLGMMHTWPTGNKQWHADLTNEVFLSCLLLSCLVLFFLVFSCLLLSSLVSSLVSFLCVC